MSGLPPSIPSLQRALRRTSVVGVVMSRDSVVLVLFSNVLQSQSFRGLLVLFDFQNDADGLLILDDFRMTLGKVLR